MRLAPPEGTTPAEPAAILPMNLIGRSAVQALGAARGLARPTGCLSMGWAWVGRSGLTDGSMERQRFLGDKLEAMFRPQ